VRFGNMAVEERGQHGRATERTDDVLQGQKI